MDAHRVLLGLAAGALMAVTAAPASAAGERPVFVLGAQSATAKRVAAHRYVVQLRTPSPTVTSFRPTGSPVVNVTTRELASQWKRLYPRRAPLATIDEHGDRRHAVLVRLSHPHLTGSGDTLALTARVVDGRGGRLADRLEDRVDRVPSSADATTVSIDTTTADAAALDAAADPITPTGPGLWLRVHAHITTNFRSIDPERYCTEYFGQKDGLCRGKFQPAPPGAQQDHGTFQWTLTSTGLDLKLWAGSADGTVKSDWLTGPLASAGDNKWVVTGWLGSPDNTVYSGNDPYWTDAPGGPLDLNVRYETTNEEYEVDVYGYVWAQRSV